MVFPERQAASKTLAHISAKHTHTRTEWYTFINNYSHSSIHRQICKAFPAPQFEDPKVKVRNQVQVGLMWKTDDQISSQAESCCRKTGLRSNPPDYKAGAVTFNGGGAAGGWTLPNTSLTHRGLHRCTGPYRRWLHASVTFISGLMCREYVRLGCARAGYVKKPAFLLSDTSAATDDLKLCALSDRKQQNANFPNGLKFTSLVSSRSRTASKRMSVNCNHPSIF